MNNLSVIWDWNGTLLNDLHPCINLINKVLSDRHLPTIDQEYYQKNFGFPVINFYRDLGFDFEQEPFETLCEIFISSYNNAVKTFPLQNGAHQCLKQLNNAEIGQFILSASNQNTLDLMMEHYQLTNLFKKISGLDNNFAASKVDNAKNLLTEFQLQKDATWLVGDTLHDYEVAKAIGVHCILIPNGHQSKARLSTSSATILDNISDIIPFLS